MNAIYLRLSGLIMAALLCLCTSCDPAEVKEKESNVVTSVNVEMLVSSETLKWAEGSFIITFSPSGRTEKIPADEIFFAFEAKPSTDIEALLLEEFKSKKVMKASCRTTCDGNDTKITVKPDLKVKQGIAATDDTKYDYEVTAYISYHKGLGAEHSTHSHNHGLGLKGSGLNDFLSRHNISLAWIDIL